jgi:hypothetical protein
MSKANKQGVIINRDVNAAERAQHAVRLRAQRLTFDEIAHKAGYASPGAARNAIQRELQRTMTTNVDELRREELDMLNRLHASIWPMAVLEVASFDSATKEPTAVDEKGKKKQPNLFAVDRIVAISERRSKLMGLDQSAKEAAIGNVVVIREVPAGLLVSE